MKAFVLILVIIISSTRVSAQEVVASSGNSGSADGYKVDWTLGETVIETFRSPNHMLTQGIHQPNLLVNNLEDFKMAGFEISVYPNPTNEFLIIEVRHDGNERLLYKIFDATGRKMFLKEMQSDREKIYLSNYDSGIYFLSLLTPDKKQIKVCKIIKK